MSETKNQVARPIDTFKALLEHKRLDLAKVAADGFDVAAVIPKILSRIPRRPELLECTPDSFYTAIHLATQLGLEPEGPHGHFYLIPRRNKHLGGRMEAVPLIGYKGLCELARRSGQIAKLDAHLIYEGEEFAYDRGTGVIRHPYSLTVDRSDAKIVGAYAKAYLRDVPDPVVVVFTRAEIEARRKRSLASGSGPWVTDYAAMCRKTVLRALLNGGLVPLTKELATAIENEAEEELKQADAVVLDDPTPPLPGATDRLTAMLKPVIDEIPETPEGAP